MEIAYRPELVSYMKTHGKKNIVVDVATSNTSDVEITELFFRFVSDRHAGYLKGKKSFRSVSTEHGEVLFPKYRLVYDDVVVFGLRKRLWFHSITCEGIKV